VVPDVVVPDVVVPDVVVLDVVVSDTVVLDAVVPGSIFFHEKENVIVDGPSTITFSFSKMGQKILLY